MARSLPAKEEGLVLLLVLWVLALISVVILSWGQEWRTELQLAANLREAHQCRRLAEAGVFYALGRIVESKASESALAGRGGQQLPQGTWWGDQSPHLLELPEGRVEVRVADESGKINLNLAQGQTLKNLFTVLGYREGEILTMVDSILNWRGRTSLAHPYGARSGYYLSLDPPYPAREGRFQVVEELSWVHGFENSPLISRLGDFLTVQGVGRINVNAAPLEVLLALGFPPDLARSLILRRQAAPLGPQDVPPRAGDSGLGPIPQSTGFKSSPFFTIISTAMINNKTGRHTIKAVVRVELKTDTPWSILRWTDDFPG